MNKQQEKQIKLKISPEIKNTGEIRLGKSARENLGFINRNIPNLEMWSNPFTNSRLYTVKKAFSKDLKQTKNKEITGFVSKEDYNKLTNYCNTPEINKQFWISTKKNTCIGSDPEFIVFKDLRQNEMVYASDVLAYESTIGSDGPLGELRALPGLTSEDHVNNLAILINDITNKLDPEMYKCRILPYATCKVQSSNHYSDRNVSCGGHIHFGLTRKVTDNPYIPDIICNILDRTLAVCMQRLDGSLGKNRRIELFYGEFGDYRNDKTLYKLEYRTLSATWLLYKDLANIVLGLSSNLIDLITSRIADLSDNIDSYNLKDGETKQMEFITNNLFPELSLLTENYSNYDVSKLLTNESIDTLKYRTYVETVLECVSQFTNLNYFEPFTKIVLANPECYTNINPDFIDNWKSGISVFDHLNISN